ncbi:MAG: hypothetical protein K8F91_26870 [Candidatus Obscuribacterales bacterium]|nr:hypothetical protein [Candidatus Obscuribacterales bacterium]
MFSSQKKLDPDDDFQNEWMNQAVTARPSAEKKSSPVRQNIEQIKQYAYDAFDKLDADSNGFIETSELYAALEDEGTPMRDKSYIMFLLTNQSEIASSAYEGDPDKKDAISRVDLELYFRLLLSRVE